MPFPLLLVPFFVLPVAAASMHARDLDEARTACRRCQPGRCECNVLAFSTTIVPLVDPGDPNRVPGHSRMLEAMDTEIELKVEALEDAGLPVPDVAVSKLSDAEIQKYLDAARVKGLIDKAIPVLLVMGVPPEAIFLGKQAIKYRYWLGPTLFDFLPERWQTAIDGAVGSDWETDRELSAAFLVGLGFSPESAAGILDAVTRARGSGALDEFGLDASSDWNTSRWDRDRIRAGLLRSR